MAKKSSAFIQVENKYYIATNSSYADKRTLLLSDSDTFGVFDRWGDIVPFVDQLQGIYHEGTRFLSESEFLVNGERPTLLSSSVKEENELLSADLTTEAFPAVEDKQSITKGTLYISRSKYIRNGLCFELLEFINFGTVKYHFDASISFRSDFHDIFEVRGMTRTNRGEVIEPLHVVENILRLQYIGLDKIKRVTEVHLAHAPDAWDESEKALYHIALEPHQRYELEYSISFDVGTEPIKTFGFWETRKKMEEELIVGREEFANVFTSNEQFNNWINRSQADLLSLLAETGEGRYPYAGIPWYNTAFGRDGIITAYETLWTAPGIARDVLLFLAKKQATEVNAFRESEPGKIFHELRGGEMVETNEIPFKQYYGSIDSTPLFVILAGAYYKRTADINTIRHIWKNIKAALDWIELYGDVDGDGFIEYKAKAESGLTNQGWKDSQDSVMDEYGRLKEAPIALCEVQGYVYDAWMQASMLASLIQENELAAMLATKADKIKKQFHEAFWDNELGTYALALDAQKKPCRVRASNAGHCLFSGIADERVAERVVQTLMAEDMFSGWGIRTLSKHEKRYNPLSYHNGSVWPHDVAIIAHGFARYGFRKEAKLLTAGLFDASLFLDLQRMPELFCGFQRRKGEGPTAYPVACSPQAWSVAAVFMLLESCLHMEINAPMQRIVFHRPSLPDFLDNILIRKLALGNQYVTLEMHRYRDGIGLDVRDNTSDWEIVVIK